MMVNRYFLPPPFSEFNILFNNHCIDDFEHNFADSSEFVETAFDLEVSEDDNEDEEEVEEVEEVEEEEEEETSEGNFFLKKEK
jgi:hypothetical protein